MMYMYRICSYTVKLFFNVLGIYYLSSNFSDFVLSRKKNMPLFKANMSIIFNRFLKNIYR